MSHFEAKMSSKGQITIPAPIRQALELKDGDRVDFYFDPAIRVARMRARNRGIEDLAGSLGDVDPSAGTPLTPRSIDDAIGASVGADHRRIVLEEREWREFRAWKKRHSADAAE
jgi:AbrB family looped-hinge helix DNA binding protein